MVAFPDHVCSPVPEDVGVIFDPVCSGRSASPANQLLADSRREMEPAWKLGEGIEHPQNYGVWYDVNRSSLPTVGCTLRMRRIGEESFGDSFAFLARGEALETAVRHAKAFITAAIASADRLGRGPPIDRRFPKTKRYPI
ncbi:MAG: hypothetical protein ACLQDM_28555 [Bradyrhizobium sp.]